MVQRKRVGFITQKSMDQNHLEQVLNGVDHCPVHQKHMINDQRRELDEMVITSIVRCIVLVLVGSYMTMVSSGVVVASSDGSMMILCSTNCTINVSTTLVGVTASMRVVISCDTYYSGLRIDAS